MITATRLHKSAQGSDAYAHRYPGYVARVRDNPDRCRVSFTEDQRGPFDLRVDRLELQIERLFERELSLLAEQIQNTSDADWVTLAIRQAVKNKVGQLRDRVRQLIEDKAGAEFVGLSPAAVQAGCGVTGPASPS